MTTLAPQTIQDFEFEATSDIQGYLSDLKGKYVVLYFYPKDNTPGCTKESQDFKSLYEEFAAFDTEIYGISKDSLKSHHSFKDKLKLPYDLITDPEGAICQVFDVLRRESLLHIGKKGIERSTFLIGPDGEIIQEWRKVKVAGHAKEVLNTLKLAIAEKK